MPYNLKFAIRSISKNRLYALISVLGLAVGMSVSILILSFVKYEVGFDGMHHGSDRIYRLNWEISGSRFATFFNGITPIYAQTFPQIETYTRLAPRNFLLTVDGVNQYADVTMVDNDFFNIFNYETLAGDPAVSIRDIASAVITEGAAEQIFPEQLPSEIIGEVFTVDQSFDFRIAAVVKNNPGNSHLGSNIFVNIGNLPEVWNNPGIFENLGSDIFYHYVRLSPGSDHLTLQSELASAYREINPGFPVDVYLQPLSDIHFTTDLQNEISMQDDVLGIVKPIRQRSDVLVFSAVAFLTLAIAAVNFMNLQLVRFAKRAREVGIKRIVGSSRSNLMGQLLTETVLIAFIALILALVLCEAFIPYFNTMVTASIDSENIFTMNSVMLMVIAAIIIGVAAGLYPATTVARLAPMHAIKGEVIKGVGSQRFRSWLIITQFAISVGLIIAAGIVRSQLNYALSSGLGFDPSNVVTVELPNFEARNAFEIMHDELASEPGVLSVSVGNIIPGRDLSSGTGFSQINGEEQSFGVRSVVVGDDYFETLGMELVAGRALDSNFPTDWMGAYSPTNVDRTGAMVINESAARQAFDSPEDAIGAEIFGDGEFQGTLYTTNATVVGVVRDAHFGSIRAEVPAIGFTLEQSRNVMMVKIAPENQAATLNAIERVWDETIIEQPIQRNFLSDSYQSFYAGEQRTFTLFVVLSFLAVLIACVGLYAVSAYVAEYRTKEISIRKVLGATLKNLIGLLAWDFTKLVIIANIVAWPLAWFTMQQWLSNFAFQADIGIGIYILAGIVTFFMALATTTQRAYQVATQNPVESLCAE